MKRLAIALISIPLIGASCISFGGGTQKVDGGVFKSADKAEKWAQKTALPTAKGIGSVANVDVVTIAQDPEDPKAIYLGTSGAGLIYSYDAGESWQRAPDVATGRVNAVVVHPKNKCVIYLAVGVRILRSMDCSRSYQAVYVDTRPDAFISALAIDWFDPRKIYAGNSAGDLLRSIDEGKSWAPIRRFEDRVSALNVSRKDSRVMLVALKSKGMFRTTDAGTTWSDLKSTFDTFPNSRTFYALIEDATAAGVYIHASRFGLLRTADAGSSWQKINLLTPPESTVIYSLTINPSNGKEIYYGTANTLYRTFDGGESWSTKRLPSTRAATALLVDSSDGNVLYLGVTKLQK